MRRTLLLLLAFLAVMGAWWLVRQDGFWPWHQGDGELVEEPFGVSDTDVPAEEDQGQPDALREAGQGEGRVALDAGFAGTIRGHVVDELSHAISGAEVLLHHKSGAAHGSKEGPIVARTRSGKDGSFDFGERQGGRYVLKARAEGWAQIWTQVWLHESWARSQDLTLRLSTGYDLQGQVVDRRGKGVAGAWVQAAWSHEMFGMSTTQEVLCDEKGRFFLEALPAGRVPLLVWSEGSKLAIAQVDASRSDPVRIELEPEGPYKMIFSLAESSTKDVGKPEHVTVQIKWMVDDKALLLPSPVGALRVPVAGTVIARGLCEGEFEVLVRSEQMVVANPQRTQMLGPDEPEAKIEFAWAPGIPLKGKLVDKEGTPAEQVHLQAWSQAGADLYTAVSDREGRWAFPPRFGPEESVMIWLASPGFRFSSEKTAYGARLAQAGDEDNLLTVLRNPVFAGRVLDAEGRALSGAHVWLCTASEPWGLDGVTTTDGVGAFRFSARLKRDEVLMLRAVHDSAFSSKPLVLEGKGRVSEEDLIIQLDKGGVVEGQIVDPLGSGLPGVRVNAVPEVEESPEDRRFTGRLKGWAVSNREGRFRITGLRPGSWKIRPRTHGFVLRGASPVLQMGLGESRKNLHLVMDRGLSLEGGVFTDDGKPLTGVPIQATFLGGLGEEEPGASRSTIPGPDGGFVLSDLRTGEYELRVMISPSWFAQLGVGHSSPYGFPEMMSGETFKTRQRAGRKGFRWTVHLPRYGGLRARFEGGSRPLQEISVEFQSGKEHWEFFRPAVKGVLVMKDVLVGSYKVRFRSPWFENLDLEVRVHQDKVNDLGLLSLVDAPRAAGRILDAEGKPVAGVWIGVDPDVSEKWEICDFDRGPSRLGGQVLALSNSEGRFRVPIKGHRQIFAFKRGYVPVTRPAGKDLVLRLASAGELRVQTPDDTESDPWSLWTVALRRMQASKGRAGGSKAEPWTRTFSLNGNELGRFVGLLPGRYRLSAVNAYNAKPDAEKNVPGESYYEEILIQAGTDRLIQIR